MKIELDHGIAHLKVRHSKAGGHYVVLQLPPIEFSVPFDPQEIHPVRVAECLPSAIQVFAAAMQKLLGRELLQGRLAPPPLLGVDGEVVKPLAIPPREPSTSEGESNGTNQ